MEDAKISVILYNELADAIEHALKDVKYGDVILLAGCQGMDDGAKIALDELQIKDKIYK